MGSMSIHECWRSAYAKNRFFRHLSETELQQRVRDVLLNMVVLTPNALIGVASPENPEVGRWMERWTYVLQEMQLRYGPFPNGFTNGFLQKDPLPDFVGELGGKAASVFASRKLNPGNAFVKYGRTEYMAALLTQGRVRIQPASFFNAKHLNGAVRDDEMSLPISLVLSRDDIVSLVQNPGDVVAEARDHVFRMSYNAGTDYWLYCASMSIEPRLFVDFDATACVIIKNQKAFSSRLQLAAAERMPAHSYSSRDAIYVDPHQPESAHIDVHFAKHFRYSYQCEYRFAWVPSAPSKALEPIDVEMGPLDDIAELIEL